MVDKIATNEKYIAKRGEKLKTERAVVDVIIW